MQCHRCHVKNTDEKESIFIPYNTGNEKKVLCKPCFDGHVLGRGGGPRVKKDKGEQYALFDVEIYRK